MLVDLRSRKKAAPTTAAQRQKSLIRAKLSCKTVRELRQFARDNHISLGGESTKQGILTEIMSQYGQQWGPRKEA
jgi:hypothetical protein